ncbi:hypothetical protein NDU88_004733 [Pleurodeles waltl]|uniref:Uncharacterized protein n=1 Tax=Pleurodeles waltl TaxID=8319 RepID=A0AAV7VL79_PLEWA|nr:hypothetical protein NDU88_004733 [Pleurodeles waltl]
MCAGSRGSARDSIGRAASWVRAALELRRSRRAVSCVPLWGGVGSVSTGRAAAPTMTSCSVLGSGKTARGLRKPAVAVEPSDQRWTSKLFNSSSKILTYSAIIFLPVPLPLEDSFCCWLFPSFWGSFWKAPLSIELLALNSIVTTGKSSPCLQCTNRKKKEP